MKQQKLTDAPAPNISRQASDIEAKIRGLGYSCKKAGDEWTAKKIDDDDAKPYTAKSLHWIYGEIQRAQTEASFKQLEDLPTIVEENKALATVDTDVHGNRTLPTMEYKVVPQLYDLSLGHLNIKNERMRLDKLEAQYKEDLFKLIDGDPKLLDHFEPSDDPSTVIYHGAGVDLLYETKTVTTRNLKTRANDMVPVETTTSAPE